MRMTKMEREMRKEKIDAEVWIQPVEVKLDDKRMCLGLQVAEVKKPLSSVKRIVEKWNFVSFGPKDKVY